MAGMHPATKVLLTRSETRFFLFVVLLFSVFLGLVDNSIPVGSAQAAFDFSVSLNGYSISLAPNHSGYVEVTVLLVSGTPQNVTLASTVSPQDAELSASLAQSWGYPSFVTTLIVNALNAQPGKQYEITVSGMSEGLIRLTPPLVVTISCTVGTCPPPSATLTTATIGQGSVNPSCPSGCSEEVGRVLNVSATPAVSWGFSGWNITGASCSNGLKASPCIFDMPNGSVSITANFIQYQTLYTSSSGQGQVSPACSGGCQFPVGSPVSIIAAPAQGWQISGYHLTSGVSCGSETGNVCSFTMPNFPVSFQVTFTESPVTFQQTVMSTSTIMTSVTTETTVASATTSTVTVTTLSVTAIGTIETSPIFSTISSSVTQTQTSFATEILDVTASNTSVTTALQNPPLELTLAAVTLFSFLMIGINLIRRSGHRGSVRCSRCGFNNPSARRYCVNCGELLKGA